MNIIKRLFAKLNSSPKKKSKKTKKKVRFSNLKTKSNKKIYRKTPFKQVIKSEVDTDNTLSEYDKIFLGSTKFYKPSKPSSVVILKKIAVPGKIGIPS